MRIISYCADSIVEAAQNGFFDWVLQQDADIFCIQNLAIAEYKLRDDVYFPRDYNPYFFDAADGKSNGVAIYTRQLPKAIMTGLGFLDFDMEGRYIQADFDNISIGSLLAPSAYDGNDNEQIRKNQFFEQYLAHLHKVRNKRRDFVICGNWNIAHKSIDIQDVKGNHGVSGSLTDEQQWMERLFHEEHYADAFRLVNTDADEFSWWPGGEPGKDGWRVDYQIVSERMIPKVEHGAIYKVQQFGKHAPIIMDYDYELPESAF
ncbi:endonuclease/exonuclease/phosphatase family protein [Spongiibacter nanhainus]|uniref:Endonuclease/exonuclease/phosphatase family protein n=1 Tax=Spongiibacter nanhainus TaxID=2794344 RepID=A0A7T4R0J4_9GAMM|nr:exodeoxyribonuclease III [Spongiibacter nanhainus]QQD18204.1 endonuclease/exonuclease/phosphatase family protein [Spongiibacter nanhainus]